MMRTASPAPEPSRNEIPAAAVGSQWCVELPSAGPKRHYQFFDGTRDELTAYARQQRARGLWALTWNGAKIGRMMPVALAGRG